jgi:glycine cleavage system aminomethyltransferase T
MERGFPRPGVDVTSLTTPVKGALIWTLDQEKLRDRKLFGWKQISGQLAKAPSHRRVGFVADEYVHAGCRIVSSPHRRLIGEVTSCAWSPILKKRLCQGFIKPEYAKLGKDFFVSVPFDLPEDITKDVRARFLRQGMQRRKFRRLVTCRVVAFPVEDVAEPGSVSEATKVKRSRRVNPTVGMKRQEGRERKASETLKLGVM